MTVKPGAAPLMQIEGLTKHFPVQRGFLRRERGAVRAVDGIDLTVAEGETVGLVGESGCGKTTVGRALLRLIEPTAGTVTFDSKALGEGGGRRRIDVTAASRTELRSLRRDMQLVFQDPYSSLDPRMRVGSLIGEPLRVHGVARGKEYDDRVEALALAVGLSRDHLRRFPHEFSGGQRQRIGIARALALNPQFVVADEPISALDVSVQAQVVNLLQDLQERFDLTFLMIGHDLSVIRYFCDRIAVMYLGRIVELAPAEDLFTAPRHPYSEALMSAIPVPDPSVKLEQIVLEGDVPSPLAAPTGCAFHPRCRFATPLCAAERPRLRELAPGHQAACHHSETLLLRPFGA